MSTLLQPILVPVNGEPDIILSAVPDFPDEVFVFLNLALLERVPYNVQNPVFKMLLARLYNAGMSGQRLKELFGPARSTLRRWGRALKSGDLDQIRDAFSGQGAVRKVTPEIERYVRDRFRELHGHCRNYNQVIRSEVERYFKTSVSCERLRWIFTEERKRLAAASGSEADGDVENAIVYSPEAPGMDAVGANSCEKASENAAICSFSVVTRNYSLQSLPGSGCAVPDQPTLCHHAGILLMSHWIDELSAGWPVHRDLVRQWVAQILLGAVNHEQSKRLSFSSLSWLLGPTISSVNYQRQLLGELADIEHTHALLQRNGRLLDIHESNLFYFDPHAAEYTGQLKTLKGWSGGLHRVDKIINMDFIHTEDGAPCFVQHADNFYDMRERFFMCIHAFRRMLGDAPCTLTWVADRGLYGLDTLRRIVDECKDHFITWEKNYTGNGWDETAPSQQFDELKARNHSEDLRCYRFEWQEHPWVRETRFQRLIVRANNPAGRQIEVAILTSDPDRDRCSVIKAMFNRWLQENDFGYMNRHVGINELTSRAHEPYATIGKELNDRQVLSREYKALRREKIAAESVLKSLLLKRDKLHGKDAEKSRRERNAQHKIDGQIQSLSEMGDNEKTKRELSKRCRKRERLLAKHKANEDRRAQKRDRLEQAIYAQRQKVHDADQCLAESVRTESRLETMIEEQYLRLDTKRKAFMDAVRISSRNIFGKLAKQFRPLYDNYRDDHFIVRELTRSAGIVHKRDGTAHLLLMPTMQFPPATRDIIQAFLAQMSQQINDHFEGQSMPIHIQLLDENSNNLDIDQNGLKWVTSSS